jgi:hypothetical protein
MTRSAIRAGAAILTSSLLAAVPPASAQESNFEAVSTPSLTAGWTITPSLIYATSYDDNVLVRSSIDNPLSDTTNVVAPGANVVFNGRKTHFDATYDGAFLMYRDFNSLNSYDQHLYMQTRNSLSKHLVLYGRQIVAAVPTTELVDFIAVPFVRTGSRLNDTVGGIEAAISKRTSLSAEYNFQWVEFDQIAEFGAFLSGGHSNGASVDVRHRLSNLLTLTADYRLQHAFVSSGRELPVMAQTFDVQNSTVGLERRLSDALKIFGALGISRLGLSDFGPARTGPSYRVGLARHFRTSSVDAEYGRSFVPSYGFGGTMQNEELKIHVQVSPTRRLYTTSSIAWRRNEPLTIGELSVRSWWVEGTVGYALQPWVRVEGFYGGSRQEITRAGGLATRNRIGFQIVTTKPMRVR